MNKKNMTTAKILMVNLKFIDELFSFYDYYMSYCILQNNIELQLNHHHYYDCHKQSNECVPGHISIFKQFHDAINYELDFKLHNLLV